MIYLHVGTGKAGSTTIQHFLKTSSSKLPYGQLQAFGLGNAWKIAASLDTVRSRQYWVEQANLFDEIGYEEFCSRFWGDVQTEVANSGHSNFIASSEYIYGQAMGDKRAIARLSELLYEIFGTVKNYILFSQSDRFC